MSNQSYSTNPAENYERFFVPAIGAPIADDLMRLAAIQEGERVLDVACGTGVVARLAAERAGNGAVAGLDINPAMLTVARMASIPERAIEWHEASAEEMPLPDEAFDVVLCQMGLQFMPDKPAALREMHRVAAPRGRLLFNVPGPAGAAFADLGEALEQHVGPEAAAMLSHVFSLEDPAELEGLVNAAGFHDTHVQAEIKTLRLPEPQAFLWQYVRSTPLAAIVQQADGDAREALERDVVEHWQAFAQDGALVCEQRIVTASAKR